MIQNRPHGFTLIELMIGLAVLVFLILIAGPQYADFLGNSQIRNGAENTLAGVRLAQTEALRGNVRTQFVFDSTPCLGGWRINRFNDETAVYDQLQAYTFTDGACKATSTSNPGGATKVTFNGLGRVEPNADTSDTLIWVEITNPSVASPRNLRVVISPATAGIKLCDPAVDVVAADPRFCPAT